ncbi:hypothetical protein CDZ98_04160 [Mameliella alba]|nr:hypothetical protein CDZ98_04160 [Mameliella alba]
MPGRFDPGRQGGGQASTATPVSGFDNQEALFAKMISHEARCIFVHQKKAAGTSVKRVFPDFELGSRNSSYLSDGLLSKEWNTAPEVREYFKFTIVRNPWDRFVSGWLYCKRTKHRPIKDVLRCLPQETISLRNVFLPDQSMAARRAHAVEFGSRGARNLSWALKGVSAQRRDWLGHDFVHIVRQQHSLIAHEDGRLAVDRILFYEELDQGLAALLDHLGLPRQEMPKTNMNKKRRDYRDYFDAEARELFEAAFGEDIAFFGYDFESGLRTRRWPWDDPEPARAEPAAAQS